MRFIAVVAALMCLTFTLSHEVQAWDDQGHRIVALVAEHYLSPDVRKQVNDMLAKDKDSLAPHDIAGAATWANKYMESDEFTTRERYEGTRAWHFAQIYANRPNLPEACFGQHPLSQGTPASKGPASACVIDKIDEFRAELADSGADPAERLLALKFLLNLVGDVHQPLHVQDQHNDYGKLIPVAPDDKSITPGSLYEYWDHAFVQSLGYDEQEIANRLIAGITPEDQKIWNGRVAHIWALEAHQIGVNYANGTMLGQLDAGKYMISPVELARGKGLVARQLSKAGIRLANVLNAALSTQKPDTVPLASKESILAGQTLAQGTCSVCHVVGRNSKTSRQSSNAPDFVAIANTRDMSPVVLREFLLGPHPTMPQLELTEKEASDVIDFVLSLRTRP